MTLGDLGDPLPLLRLGEPHPRRQAGVDRLVAARPAEDEVDRRQHALVVEPVDGLDPPRRVQPAPGPAPHRRPAPARRPGIEPGSFRIGPQLDRPVGCFGLDERREDVDLLRLFVAHQVEVPEPHRAPFLDDRLGLAAHGLDPVGELLRVGHRGRQAHEVDLGWEVDDDLFPHGAAVGVLEIVDLVEDDVAQPAERR